MLLRIVFMASCCAVAAVDVDEFMQKYGYLEKLPKGAARDPQDRSNAIRQYQKNYGLKVTGQMNAATIKQMRAARCGLPDIWRPENAPVKYRAPGFKWKKTTLLYSIRNNTPDLPSSSVSKAIRLGFKYWTDVTPLHIAETRDSSKADFQVSFESGNHGDGVDNAFDKAGGVLAHAYFPEDGRIHFDEAESWTERSVDGVNLEIVATHEFGHALGLDHSFTRGAVMYPSYQGYDPKFVLHEDDREGIASLYGRKPQPTTTTAKPKNGGKNNGGSSSPACKISSYNAALLGHDKKTYFFKGKKFYKLPLEGKHTVHLLSKRFPKAPSNIAAATYSEKRKQYYLVKGRTVYQYSRSFKFERKIRLPKNMPYNPDAMLAWKDSRTDKFFVFFKGTKFFTYDIDRNKASGPHSMGRYFKGVPTRTHAALTWLDHYVYFFKGRKFWKLDAYRRRIQPGSPKSTIGWPLCKSSTNILRPVKPPKRSPPRLPKLPLP